MQITITQDELNAYAKKHHDRSYITGYNDIAEDLGECLDVGSIQDEYWYFEAIHEAENYVRNEYNYEADLLAMNDQQFANVCQKLGHNIPISDGIHTLVAGYALANPEDFEQLIQECKDADQDVVMALFPDLEKDINEAITSTEEEMRRDFVSGDDRGNFEGLERLLCKEFNAESADVRDYDSVTIDWNDEDAKELLRDAGYKADLRQLKGYVISRLVSNAMYYKNKCKAEAEARKAERERVVAYKAECKTREEAERKAKLDAIRL